MKLITAIIKPFKLDDVKLSLILGLKDDRYRSKRFWSLKDIPKFIEALNMK